MTKKGVGLKEVAAKAGVSLATASYALRTGKRAAFISEETQSHVRQLAERLGYRIHPSARNLRSGKCFSIAIVCGLLRDLSATAAAESIIAYLNTTPYAGVVVTCGQVRDIKNYVLNHLPSRCHDAVIFIRDDHFITPALLRDLTRKGIRTAAIMPSKTGLGRMPLAYLNREQAARLMIEKLVEQGHRRLDFVYPRGTSNAMIERACQTAPGISIRRLETAVVHDEANAFRLGIDLVSSHLKNSKATGIAVFTENLALGVIYGFTSLGIQVPADKSILGYGASALFAASRPQVSAVSHPIEEIGASIARQTIQWIESGYRDAKIEIKQFSPRYISGDTLAPPSNTKPIIKKVNVKK